MVEHTIPFTFESSFKFGKFESLASGHKQWNFKGFRGNQIADMVQARRICREALEAGFIGSIEEFPEHLEVFIKESEIAFYKGPEEPEKEKSRVVIEPKKKDQNKKKEKSQKAPVETSENEVSLEALAAELVTTPQKLRSKLRKKGHQKSGLRWSWEKGSEEIEKIRSYFK